VVRVSFADADGVSIRCIDHGGDGPDLVLVHATGFHANVWDPYVPRLQDRFRVVAIDQRGHGGSDKPPAGYEWEAFGRDVLAAVDHLGLSEPAGVGHSAGAAALVLAQVSRPSTFSRLVLLDPVTPPPEWREAAAHRPNPMAETARGRRAVWESREQMSERLRAGSPLQTWRPEFLRAYVQHGTSERADGCYELCCPPEVEAQIYETSQRQLAWEGLAELRCPTLVVGGTHPTALWRDTEPATRRNPCVAGATVEGGHFFPMEDPEGTLAVVLPFLGAAA